MSRCGEPKNLVNMQLNSMGTCQLDLGHGSWHEDAHSYRWDRYGLLGPCMTCSKPRMFESTFCAACLPQINGATSGEEVGRKDDTDKLRYDLLPFVALREVTKVLTNGAKKYGPHNWRLVDRVRFVAAAFRHLVAYSLGEKNDPEWGIHHLAHAACNLMFIVELDEEKDPKK